MGPVEFKYVNPSDDPRSLQSSVAVPILGADLGLSPKMKVR
jgi:hypothetical protein